MGNNWTYKSRPFVTVIIAVVLFSPALLGQEKRVYNHIDLSVGGFFEGGKNVQSPGIAIRLGYGADIKLTDRFSLMPGAGVRGQKAALGVLGNKGGSSDGLLFTDVLCQARYHFKHIIIGLGPNVSFAVANMNYGVENYGDPTHPLVGKKQFSTIDVGLVPSISVPFGKHWEFGVEAIIGLTNMRIRYEDANAGASTYMHTVSLFFGYRF